MNQVTWNGATTFFLILIVLITSNYFRLFLEVIFHLKKVFHFQECSGCLPFENNYIKVIPNIHIQALSCIYCSNIFLSCLVCVRIHRQYRKLNLNRFCRIAFKSDAGQERGSSLAQNGGSIKDSKFLNQEAKLF